MASDPTPASELTDLAAAVRRLRPDWRNTADFYERRSEIARALMRLSLALVGRAVPAPSRGAVIRPEVIAAPMPRMSLLPRLIARHAMPVIVRQPRRAAPARRHRFPRPPTLPADVQARLL